MKPCILVIDDNPEIEKAKTLTTIFEMQGIGTVLVGSMSAAMEEADNPHIIGIGINADHVDYMDMLKILRDSFSVVIIVVTSNYDIQECSEALKAGASFYGDWRENLADHPVRALAEIERYNGRHFQPKLKSNFIYYHNILIYPKFREVFIKDKKTEFMKIEYELLYYLMSNHDHTLSPRQINKRVWKDEYTEESNERLYIQMSRLRKKLCLATEEPDRIQTVKGYGYKFVTSFDR